MVITRTTAYRSYLIGLIKRPNIVSRNLLSIIKNALLIL